MNKYRKILCILALILGLLSACGQVDNSSTHEGESINDHEGEIINHHDTEVMADPYSENVDNQDSEILTDKIENTYETHQPYSFVEDLQITTDEVFAIIERIDENSNFDNAVMLDYVGVYYVLSNAYHELSQDYWSPDFGVGVADSEPKDIVPSYSVGMEYTINYHDKNYELFVYPDITELNDHVAFYASATGKSEKICYYFKPYFVTLTNYNLDEEDEQAMYDDFSYVQKYVYELWDKIEEAEKD